MKHKEQNLTNPRMICDKCKLVIPLGAMYWKSDLGRTFCSDCYKEIEETINGLHKPDVTLKKLEKLKLNLNLMQHAFNGALDTDNLDFKMEAISLFVDIKSESLEILEDLIKEQGKNLG